jgi:hypothetical protein
MAWANDGGYIPNAFRCSPVDPTPAGVGDQCYVEGSAVSGVDNCEVGAACWDVNYNTNEGFCHRICGAVPDEPICPDGQICNSIGALHLCVDTCDPLESATCQDGTACQPANAGFGCMASPFPQGGNAIGGGCISDHACEPGAICVDKDLVPDCGYDGCCAELCDMGPPPYGCSQEDTNCWAIPDAPDLPSYQDVGVCRL